MNKNIVAKFLTIIFIAAFLAVFSHIPTAEAKGAVNAVVEVVKDAVEVVSTVVTTVATAVVDAVNTVTDAVGLGTPLDFLANKDCSDTRTWSTSQTSYAINAVSANPGQITSDGISSSVISADASEITNTNNCSQITSWKTSGTTCSLVFNEVRIDETTGPEQCATTSSSVSAPANFSVTSSPAPTGSLLVSDVNSSVYVDPASGNQTTLFSAFSKSAITAVVTAARDSAAQSVTVFMPAVPNSAISPVNLKATQGDPCVAPLQATLSWDLSASAPSQTAYQIQIDTDSNFPFPALHDTGKVTSSSQSYTAPTGVLNFGATYYWRVKILDSLNRESSWANGPSFTTISHKYPSVDFNWSPKNPSAGETVQFTDKSVSYGGTSVSGWLWTFPDAACKTPAIGCASVQNPKVVFQSEGLKSISLKATDSNGFSCTTNKEIQAKPPLPGFKEVGPAQ